MTASALALEAVLEGRISQAAMRDQMLGMKSRSMKVLKVIPMMKTRTPYKILRKYGSQAGMPTLGAVGRRTSQTGFVLVTVPWSGWYEKHKNQVLYSFLKN